MRIPGELGCLAQLTDLFEPRLHQARGAKAVGCPSCPCKATNQAVVRVDHWLSPRDEPRNLRIRPKLFVRTPGRNLTRGVISSAKKCKKTMF